MTVRHPAQQGVQDGKKKINGFEKEEAALFRGEVRETLPGCSIAMSSVSRASILCCTGRCDRTQI